jgi:hypothetical protein
MTFSLAGQVAPAPFVFTDANALTIGIVDGVTGITTQGGDINVAAGANLTISHVVDAGLGSATLSGNGVINVNALISGSSATVKGGAGNDIFNIGSGAGLLNGAVINFLAIDGGNHSGAPFNPTQSVNVAPTTVFNRLSVGDVVNLNDQADAAVSTFTVTATDVTLAGTGLISLSNVQTLNVNTGTAADNTVDVTGTAANTTTNITSGGGNSIVGVFGSGTHSNVVVNAAAAGSRTTVYNSGDSSVVQIIGSSGVDQFTMVNSGQRSGVAFSGAGNTNIVDVFATGGLGVTAITGGNGLNAVTFGNGSNSLGGILGAVSFTGGAGAVNGLTIADNGQAGAESYLVAATEVNRTGVGRLFYAGVTQLVVLAAQGNNTINIQSQAAATPISIFDGPGNSAINATVGPQSGYNRLFVDGGTGNNFLSFVDPNGANDGAVIHRHFATPTAGFVSAAYSSAGSKASELDFTNMFSVFVSPNAGNI